MSDDEIVGHKTFHNGRGGFRHEPLRRSEADALMARIEADEERRKATMPDEAAAINALFDAWQRLQDFGWRDCMYCPKDGSVFDVIEAGSTGIFRCTYDKKPATGTFWVQDLSDLCPSHPFMFREIKKT